MGDYKNRNSLVWKLVGGVALALFAAGVISNLRDIKRYVRISTM